MRIVRGQFAKKEGKVERVDTTRARVFVAGAELIKKDGAKVQYPLHPSNLLVIELELGDKERKAKIEKLKAGAQIKLEKKKITTFEDHQ